MTKLARDVMTENPVCCTPETPLGATMVSAEGACAAYYRYGRAHTAEAAS